MAYVLQVNDHPDPPLVHSISWGDAEALFPPVFVERLDYELMKMALRGITTLVASGDNGISAVQTKCVFLPDVLGSSPWVTSVGATMPSLASAPFCESPLFRRSMGPCAEPGPITCSVKSAAIITSSGYWSLYRSQPSYQDDAVKNYLRDAPCKPCAVAAVANESVELTTPCQHLSSASASCALRPLLGRSRASPDVAAPGSSFPTLVNGTLAMMDGTSASAPALAAVISLLNAEQKARGQPPLGFLNPWLYGVYAKHPGAFTDVLLGDIGSNEDHFCPWGFVAAFGWDPATGLGVPRMEKLRHLLPSRGQPQQAAVPQAENLASQFTGINRAAAATQILAIFALCAVALAVFAHKTRRASPRLSLKSPWRAQGGAEDNIAGYRSL